jgi:hypothetical protein
LEKKRRQKEKAMHIEDTERLVTEIEMLKVVLFLVCRNRRTKEQEKEKLGKQKTSNCLLAIFLFLISQQRW